MFALLYCYDFLPETYRLSAGLDTAVASMRKSIIQHDRWTKTRQNRSSQSTSRRPQVQKRRLLSRNMSEVSRSFD
ncbi:hypothetical protein HWV62_34855 [Athelia sp. TMB]|nr:hypothetical protein HWV62_34855 [Athelia sp. TMB]